MSPFSAAAEPSGKHALRNILFWVILFAAGTAARLFHLFQFQQSPVFQHVIGADVLEYYDCARCILMGMPLPAESLIHAPLYPRFLALLMMGCGDSMFALRLTQSFLCMTGVIPFFLALKQSFRHVRSPLASVPYLFSVFYVLVPFMIVYQCDFFSENLMMILLGISAAFLTRAVQLGDGRKKSIFSAAAGVSAGLGAVTHPVMLFWGAGVVLYLYFREKKSVWNDRARILRPVLFAAAMAAAILPTTVSNYIKTSEFIPIQKNSMFNLWLGNSAEANGGCRIRPGDEWEEIHSLPDKAGVSSDRYFAERLLTDLKNKPARVLANLPEKALLLFSPFELTTWSDTTILRGTSLWPRISGLFGLTALFGLTGFLLFCRNRMFRKRCAVFLVMLGSFTASQILLVAAGRYRLPVVPGLLLCSAYFFCALPAIRFKWKMIPAFGLSALIVIAAAGFSPFNLQEELQCALSYTAEAWQNAGSPGQAVNCLTGIDPDKRSSRTWNLLGNLYFDQHRLQDAEQCFQKALNLRRSAETLSNAGRVRMELKDYAGAAACFQEALSKTSGHAAAPVLYNFGILFQRTGNPAKALETYEAAVLADPLFDRAWNNSGILALERSDFQKAVFCFRQALKTAPAKKDRVVNLAYALFASGQKDAALKELDQVLKLKNPPARAQELKTFILTGK